MKITIEKYKNNIYFITNGRYSQSVFFHGFNPETKKEIIAFDFPEILTQNQRFNIAKKILKIE